MINFCDMYGWLERYPELDLDLPDTFGVSLTLCEWTEYLPCVHHEMVINTLAPTGCCLSYLRDSLQVNCV
jgi:hypothetical protein